MGHGHMQQYSGRLRVIAYFCAMFKDFLPELDHWNRKKEKKKKKRRERREDGDLSSWLPASCLVFVVVLLLFLFLAVPMVQFR